MPGIADAIRRHGVETYPNECCGALIGADGVVEHVSPLPNTTEEGARRRFLIRPSDYKLVEEEATRLETGAAGVLSLASRSSGAAFAIRPRSRVAIFLVRDRFHSAGPAREDDGVAAGRRSLAVPRSATYRSRALQTMANKILIPTPLTPVHRKAGCRRGRRRDGWRAARRSDDEVRGAEAAPVQRAGQAAQLRQRLSERRRHPLPGEGEDAGEAGRHDQHHSVGRRGQQT